MSVTTICVQFLKIMIYLPYLFAHDTGVIHSFSILSDDRSKASSKTIPPHGAI